MSHTSPAGFMVWAIISVLLGCFLFFHLWSFDRFQCLKWSSGPNSGAFKRIMTYSYLISVPLITTYAVGNAVIKYLEGLIQHPEFGIIPKPYQLWRPIHQHSVFPLLLIFSVAWGLEMVTHLEELCFWLYLVNSGSSQKNWFKSWYFITWIVGSCIAVVYMPLVTIISRDDPLHCEAFTFVAGSLGSLCLTLWFIPILWAFPGFLQNLKDEGLDIGTIVRLTKFAELNFIRVIFRFLFVVPLLILGIDGIRPHKHVNESMFWTDFLVILAGFGCAISSGITLTIFFPRSIEGEITAKDTAHEAKLLLKEQRKLETETHTTGGAIRGSTVSHRSSARQSFLRRGRLLGRVMSGSSRHDTLTDARSDDAGSTLAGQTYLLTSSPVHAQAALPPMHDAEGDYRMSAANSLSLYSQAPSAQYNTASPPNPYRQHYYDEERDVVAMDLPRLHYGNTPSAAGTPPGGMKIMLRPNRMKAGKPGEVELGGIDVIDADGKVVPVDPRLINLDVEAGLTEGNLSLHDHVAGSVSRKGGRYGPAGAPDGRTNFNQIKNFRSPLDFVYHSDEPKAAPSKLTFHRPS